MITHQMIDFLLLVFIRLSTSYHCYKIGSNIMMKITFEAPNKHTPYRPIQVWYSYTYCKRFFLKNYFKKLANALKFTACIDVIC